MTVMRENFPSAGGVTFCQVAPLSRDRWTSPSSLPVHRTPACFGDSANAYIVAYHSVPVMSPVTGPPERPMVFGSCTVRSGEIFSQLCPSFFVRHTNCEVV